MSPIFSQISFKEALKENNLFPRVGTFSYSQRTPRSSLPTGLHGNGLADFLENVIGKSPLMENRPCHRELPQRAATLAKDRHFDLRCPGT